MSIENSARGLLETFKKITVSAVASTSPTEIRIGTVISVLPLMIKLSPKMTLDSGFLIVGERFKEQSYQVKIGDKEERVILHNGLNKGDVVTLLRAQGGQKYVLLDKVEGSPKPTDEDDYMSYVRQGAKVFSMNNRVFILLNEETKTYVNDNYYIPSDNARVYFKYYDNEIKAGKDPVLTMYQVSNLI